MERAAAVVVVGEVSLVGDKGLRTLEGRGVAGGGRLSKSIPGEGTSQAQEDAEDESGEGEKDTEGGQGDEGGAQVGRGRGGG